FNQSNGLAHGQTTWTDPYWFGTPENPSTQPAAFASIAGGQAGQAFVGNVGFIGGRLQIDPASGALQSLVGLAATSGQQPNPAELPAQQRREVSAIRSVVDLNGPGGGAAYSGGFHGTSTLRGLTQPRQTATCGCFEYEEHVHPLTDTSI